VCSYTVNNMAAGYKMNDLKRLKKDELYDIAKDTVNEPIPKSKKKADLIELILSTCTNTTTIIPGTASFDFVLRYRSLSQTDMAHLPNISFSDIYAHITGYYLSVIMFLVLCVSFS